MKALNKKKVVAVALFLFFFAVLLWLNSALRVESTDVKSELVLLERTEENAVYLYRPARQEERDAYYLNLKTKGTVIKAYLNEEVIYEYGERYAEEGKMIGKIFSRILLPDEAYREWIRIELVCSDNGAEPEIETAYLCHEQDEAWYYLTNETIAAVLVPLYVFLGLAAILTASLVNRQKVTRTGMILLGLVFLCMSVEFLDTGGHYLMFIRNQHAWNLTFQMVSFLFPVICLGYYYTVEQSPGPKKCALWALLINTGVFLFAFATSLSGVGNFSDCRPLLIWEMAADLIPAAYAIYWMVKKRSYPRQYAVTLVILAVWLIIVVVILSGARDTSLAFSTGFGLDLETIEAVCILFILFYMLTDYVRTLIEKGREEAVKIQQMKQELETLRYRNFNSQMQPHFLYNALSSIKEIIYEDQDYASKIIGDFTTHLRGTIRAMSSDDLIPFSEELRNIEAYVSIEKMRFRDKLEMHYDIETSAFDVVPLSIQPIVENAIKHGIYERGRTGGSVMLRSRETEAAFIVEIKDNGVGFDVEKVRREAEEGKRDSVGLKNLHYRLETLMHAKLVIESTPGVGTDVTVTIPKGEYREK